MALEAPFAGVLGHGALRKVLRTLWCLQETAPNSLGLAGPRSKLIEQIPSSVNSSYTCVPIRGDPPEPHRNHPGASQDTKKPRDHPGSNHH
eukprot:7120621-Alexandrium_andersonii.AAC.1